MDDKENGVDLAFSLVLPSYHWAVQRWDAMEARLHTLIVFATTLTVGVLAFVHSVNDDSTSFPLVFWAAMVTFVILLAVGMYVRATGTVRIIDPARLRGWTGYDAQEFKLHLLKHAGQDADTNFARIETRGRVVVGLTGLFLLEAALLAVWAMGQG